MAHVERIVHEWATEASYIVYKVGTDIRAVNGKTGHVEFRGTDAATVIQSAIDALTPGRTSKERIVLKGNFNITKHIKLPDFTVLDLTGAKLTLVADDYVIRNSDPTNGNRNIEVIGGTIDGNKAAGYSHNVVDFAKVTGGIIRGCKILNAGGFGISLFYSSRIIVTDNYVKDGASDGITSGEGCSYNIISNNVVENCSEGIDLIRDCTMCLVIGNTVKGASGTTAIHPCGTKNVVIGNVVEAPAGYGIYTRGYVTDGTPWEVHDIAIIGNIIKNGGGATQDGIRATVVGDAPTDRILIEGNVITGMGGNGILIADISDCKVIGNTVSGCSAGGVMLWANAGDVERILIANNALVGNAYGIRYQKGDAYTLDHCARIGNNLNGNTIAPFTRNVVAAGANDIVFGNIGYISENARTATIASGTSSVVVAHGLAETPTVVVVTGRHPETSNAVVTARDDTNITITVGANVTADREVDWYAKV